MPSGRRSHTGDSSLRNRAMPKLTGTAMMRAISEVDRVPSVSYTHLDVYKRQAYDRLVLDPGFGFGKTLEQNLELLRCFDVLATDGLPMLAGISRKSMLGAITGKSVEQRLSGSLAAAVLAAQRGARILRVHDVAETKDALAVWRAASK